MLFQEEALAETKSKKCNLSHRSSLAIKRDEFLVRQKETLPGKLLNASW